MLRSNNPNLQTRGEPGHTEEGRTFKSQLMDTQINRSPLKQNRDQFSPTFRILKNATEVSETELTPVSSRIQSIRNKYQDSRNYKWKKDNSPESSPLKDSKRVNRVLNIDYKKETDKGQAPELQRSFSFVSKQPPEIKSIEQSSRAQWKNYGNQKTESSHNNSSSLFEEVSKTKPGQIKHSHQQKKSVSFQSSELKLHEQNSRKFSQYSRKVDLGRKVEGDKLDPNEPRIESIDKINIKIKQILRCIHDTGRPPVTAQVSDNRSKINQTQQKITSTSNYGQTHQNNGHHIPKKSIYDVVRSNYSRVPTQTIQIDKNMLYKQDTLKNSHTIRMKTTEGIETTTTKSNIFKEKDSQEGKNGKDIDFEIKKIQDKIKRSQQEKVKLNIRFDELKANAPSRPEQIKSTSVAKHVTYSYKSHAYTQKRIFDKVEVPKTGIRKNTTFEASPLKQEKKQETPSKFSNTEVIPPAEPFAFKLVKVQCDSDVQRALTQQSKKFIESLKEQVRLDEQFRNAKIWFDICSVPDKWKQLQSQLVKNGISRSIEQIKKEFQCSLEENNPFYSSRNSSDSINSLVQKYTTCQKYWEKSILKSFDSKQLQAENFVEGKVDLQRKGYLTVEDFVRFLNIETGTFYRNRDLILLFKRLATEKVTFSQMLEALTKK